MLKNISLKWRLIKRIKGSLNGLSDYFYPKERSIHRNVHSAVPSFSPESFTLLEPMEKNGKGFAFIERSSWWDACSVFLYWGFSDCNHEIIGVGMNRILFIFLIFFITGNAKCSSVTQSVRDDYASGMLEAFITQSYGRSTVAFYQFDVAREKAKKAGENILRLIAIERLFSWYRMYASSLRLYHKYPTGHDRIRGEYRPAWAHSPLAAYESEWGKNPEQARIMRDFMFGVGEVIAGVFCASVSAGSLGFFGGGAVVYDGATRIFNSLNSLWALHQTELAALKDWESTALKPALNQ